MENEKLDIQKTGFEPESMPTEQVEDVVIALDEAFQYCRANPDDFSCDCSALHSRICHTEVQRLFQHYEKHEVLTHDDIEKSINAVLRKLETEMSDAPEDEFISRRFQLLKERPREIKLATRRYVQTISKFFHIKKQQFRLDPVDFKAEFEKIDRIRRNAHDGLIETLTIYTRTINELYRYGALDGLEIKEWHVTDRFGSDLPPEDTILVFAGDVLRNRDLVKDWAVSAHLNEKLSQIEEMQKGHST